MTGVASLILSIKPNLTAKQVTRMVMHSARDIEVPGVDQYTGFGLLDARAALSADPEFFVDAWITGVKVVREGGKVLLRVIGTADANQMKQAWIEILVILLPSWSAWSGNVSGPSQYSRMPWWSADCRKRGRGKFCVG